jgi:hypothetical protein
MVEMLKPGVVISYHVPADELVGAFVGSAPIIGVNCKNYLGVPHFVVMHEGTEIVVYLEEVTE